MHTCAPVRLCAPDRISAVTGPSREPEGACTTGRGATYAEPCTTNRHVVCEMTVFEWGKEHVRDVYLRFHQTPGDA